MLTIAGADMTNDEARKHLAAYAERHHQTIRYYDYNDDVTTPPAGSDGVLLGDIARLVIINARLAANDVAHLLEPVPQELWDAVPLDADFRSLPDDPSGHPLYRALDDLYGFVKKPGIAQTKATKLLHLKRPGLMPIIDTVVRKKAYSEVAKATAAEFGQRGRMYWAAVWRDARVNAEPLGNICQDLKAQGDAQALVARLPLLRLHDILVWSRFSR